MSKMSTRAALMAVATTVAVALPSVAQAGVRHDDCVHRMVRDVDRSMTRVVSHTDRMLKDMFRWCDRRHRR